MRDIVTGVIGIILLVGFLGILVWWIKSVPLTVIIVGSLLVMLYDFVQTMRHGEGGAPVPSQDQEPAIRRG
jgi:hypothetical protein